MDRDYVISLDNRIGSLETKLEDRFNQLDAKIDPLIQFKHESIGRSVIISGLVGFFTAVVIQIGVVIFRVKMGN